MNKEFITLCKMSQKELKNHVAVKLAKMKRQVSVGDGYVYSKGNFPVLLVAHLDTVHKKLPDKILYDAVTKSVSSHNGIGGDDRCGVYMIFEVAKIFDCSILFCEDEEIGGIGAQKFIKSDIAKDLSFNYMIEFDRKGSNDAVFYQCDNPEFEDFITMNFYKTDYGSFSDISYLAPHFGCAAVNLSCGYYKAHTNGEYVMLQEMENSIRAACDILARTTDNDKFEYIEAKYDYWTSYNYGYKYNNYFDNYTIPQSYDPEDWYVFEYVDKCGKTKWYDVCAYSEVEAIGQFCMANPEICVNDIIDMCHERIE